MIDKIQGILKFMTLPADKSSHAMYGLIVWGLVSIYNPEVAICLVLFMGISKEIIDRYIGGTRDVWDAVATIAVPLVLYIITYFK